MTSFLIEAVLFPRLEVFWLMFIFTSISLYRKDESVRGAYSVFSPFPTCAQLQQCCLKQEFVLKVTGNVRVNDTALIHCISMGKTKGCTGCLCKHLWHSLCYTLHVGNLCCFQISEAVPHRYIGTEFSKTMQVDCLTLVVSSKSFAIPIYLYLPNLD